MSPDGIDVFAAPESHSFWCLMMQGCYDSGFDLIVDGKVHTVLSDAQNTAVRAYLDAQVSATKLTKSTKDTVGLQATVTNGTLSGFCFSSSASADVDVCESAPTPAPTAAPTGASAAAYVLPSAVAVVAAAAAAFF